MNRKFDLSTDVSPAALEAVMRQAQAARFAFVAAILIGFGKKIKDLIAGRASATATGSHRLRGSAA